MQNILKITEFSAKLLTLVTMSFVITACQQRGPAQDVYRQSDANTNGSLNSRAASPNSGGVTVPASGSTGSGVPNPNATAGNGSLAGVPQHMQDYEYCRRLLGGPVDYSNPDGARCYQVVYQNCRGCRVDEDLRPIDVLSAFGYSGRIAWPAHENWWPQLTPYLNSARSHIAFQSPYFNQIPGGAHPGAVPGHPGGRLGQPGMGGNGRLGGQNPYVYCHNRPRTEPCQLDATKVWSVSNIDRAYQYNLAPGKSNQFMYNIVQPLNQPCQNQHQIQQNNCNPQFRQNFGNILGGLGQAGESLKASGQAILGGLGNSLMNIIPQFSAGSLVPNINVNAGGNYTVTPGGNYTAGSAGRYATSQPGNYTLGSGQTMGMYAGQPMAAYGHYLNYSAMYNNHNIGGSRRCAESTNYHPGYYLGCQDVTPCQIYGGNC